MEEQTLIPLPDQSTPLVALGSAPGPAPALDERPPAPAHEYTVIDAIMGRYEGVFYAQLCQREPSSGKRGWWLLVQEGDDSSLWPHRDISRPGMRAPLPGARLAALAALGYEPANGPDAAWEWREMIVSDGRTVLLTAQMPVRRQAAAGSAAAQ